MPLPSKKFALDLGNNNTLLANEQKLLATQPSFIAFEEATGRTVAVGADAYKIYEKHPDSLKAIKPLRWGVIADYDSAHSMIRELVKRHCPTAWWESFDHVISGVPFDTTEVERRALRQALEQFRARKTHLFFEPLAAATGMGLDIRTPEGKMVVDIGGGITEMVVISLSGIAVFRSSKVAGDALTDALQDHFRRAHNLSVGWRTAEQIKQQAGRVLPAVGRATVVVRGKDLITGIPVTRTLPVNELATVLDAPFQQIETGILQTLEVCPPELAADIYQHGIYLTGGSALLGGVPERLQQKLKLPVRVDAHPLTSVSEGVARALREPARFGGVLFE
jgi:rod shape-determining protein MreB